MAILLTGASGFIGRTLLGAADSKIVPMYRKSRSEATHDEVVFDLAADTDIDWLCGVLRDKDIQSIVHAAAVTPWSASVDYDDDIKMAKTLCHVCQLLKIPNLYLISGWNVYDVNSLVPFTEQTVVLPSTTYGKSKLATEKYFEDNLENTKLVTLRLASAYGPGQVSAGLITNLVKDAFTNKQITISNSNIKRDYIYIGDVVEVIVQLCGRSFTDNQIFNLGSDASISVGEVANTIRDICRQECGFDISVHEEPGPGTGVLPLDNALSNANLQTIGIDYDHTTFRDGVAKYIEWARNENIF